MISINFVILVAPISVLLVTTVHSNQPKDPNYGGGPHINSGSGVDDPYKTRRPKTTTVSPMSRIVQAPSTPRPPIVSVSCPVIPCPTTELDFSGMGLIRFDESVIRSSGVVHLNISDNKIVHVSPTAFTKLPDLVTLDMSRNKIPLAKLLQYKNLNRLENLYLDGNNGTKSDYTICESEAFPHLKRLYMRGNHIKVFGLDLKQIAHHLTYLDLSQNNISSSDFIETLPYSLTHLIVNDNLIEEVTIPYSISSHIEILSMNRNKFTVLCFNECSMKSAFQISMAPRLRDLDLSGNKITEIHGVYDHSRCSQIPSSNELKLIGNYHFCGVRNLQSLSLSHNQLKDVPNICTWPNLRNLDLSYNNIEVVDTRSCKHLNLKILNLSGNKISSVHYHPFNAHNTLEELDLSNNRIVELPSGWITSPSSLRVLRLTNNLISDLEQISLADMRSLRDLHIENNPMLKFKLRPLNHLVTQLVIHIKLEDITADNTEDNEIDDDSNESKESNRWF